MKTGDTISIDFINAGDQPPYRQLGIFRSEDEDSVRVEGAVGDDIGKDIIIPKSNIKRIVVI